MTGERILHYQILEKLGQGGMGLVYKARDTRLNRFVAVKVLPPGKMLSTERRARFVQEAQAASALNHPNIITIHDIVHDNDGDYIVMEFVRGKALDELIPENGLPLRQMLDYAAAIADGLTAAHAAKIVHRDLKPANIMVSEEGHVKLLDFGLAKLTDSSESGDDEVTQPVRPLTEEGAVLGTLAYMSPEQTEGKRVDARSDIFSLGAVLYEMATGHRAFTGSSRMSTAAAILQQEPPAPHEVSPAIPRELERVILRCLRKDPARRFQSVAGLKVALEELREESQSGKLIPGHDIPLRRTARPRWWSVRPFLYGAGILALVAAALTWYKVRPGAGTETPVRVVPLTSYAGAERNASFSPDGTQVAFSWNEAGDDREDVYVRFADGGTPLQLTTGTARNERPVWSPDGRLIAFIRNPGPGGAIFQISPLGGPERKLAALNGESLAWSADTRWLAYQHRNSEHEGFSVIGLFLPTGEKRKLTAPPNNIEGDTDPAFAPDGSALAWVRRSGGQESDLYIASLRNPSESRMSLGEPRRLTHDSRLILGIAWTSDSRQLVFSSNRFGEQSLWHIPVNSRNPQPQRLSSAEGSVRYPAISRAKDAPARLVYENFREDINIWRTALPELEGSSARRGPTNAAVFISSTRTDSAPEFSPDGKMVAFVSDRSGGVELSLCDGSGGNTQQLTSMSASSMRSPRWSPDGSRIAFEAGVSGTQNIYVIRVDGGAPRRVNTGSFREWRPSWSRDGRWIYFASDRTERPEIWKTAAEGSGAQAVQVTRNGGYEGLQSSDGQNIYYLKDSSGKELWSAPVSGGNESVLLPSVSIGLWSVAKAGIYFVDVSAAGNPVKLFDPVTRRMIDLAALGTRLLRRNPGFSVSQDGRSMLWSQTDHADSDLVLVDNFHY